MLCLTNRLSSDAVLNDDISLEIIMALFGMRGSLSTSVQEKYTFR